MDPVNLPYRIIWELHYLGLHLFELIVDVEDLEKWVIESEMESCSMLGATWHTKATSTDHSTRTHWYASKIKQYLYSTYTMQLVNFFEKALDFSDESRMSFFRSSDSVIIPRRASRHPIWSFFLCRSDCIHSSTRSKPKTVPKVVNVSLRWKLKRTSTDIWPRHSALSPSMNARAPPKSIRVRWRLDSSFETTDRRLDDDEDKMTFR